MSDFQHFDDVIDATARGLTAGDPPADLRTRVMARLDERPSRPWRWKTAAACAAAVAVAATVVGLHDRAPSPAAAETHARTMTPNSNDRLAASPQILVPDPKLQDPRPRPNIETRRRRVVASAPSGEELAWQARAIPALEPPDPLTVEEIQPSPLEIRPLVTEPLTVPAIGEDENRNPDGPKP
jgi:hypothetical protein